MATLCPTTTTRQPFAPIEGSRLQNLTSLKNRQNAIQMSSPIKRKATVFEDTENVDPLFSPKRNRGIDSKPSPFVLTKAAQVTSLKPVSPIKARPVLQARSPAPKPTATPFSAPAGRSPTRKRSGILNRRKTASPFTRVDPPKFSLGTAEAPFSIAAALSGTIPSYSERAHLPIPVLHQAEEKAGWFFEIHEDTTEETMHNLMEHSTCILDISSDEETEARHKDDRGKENMPPLDDISQSRARLPRQKEEYAIEIDRLPLGALAAADFYVSDCSELDVLIVDEQEHKSASQLDLKVEETYQKGKGKAIDIEELMKVQAPSKAALFEPLEKAEDNFQLWESGSAKGDE